MRAALGARGYRSVYATVPIGAVDITPSREGLRDTPRTLLAVRDVLDSLPGRLAAQVQSELDALAAQVRDHDVAIAALTAEIEVARSELDVELVQIDVDRAAAAECVPAEVMSAYEVTRTQMGGIGAARLLGNRCEGCHLEIPSAELEAVRRAPEDAVVTCPECGRILVR